MAWGAVDKEGPFLLRRGREGSDLRAAWSWAHRQRDMGKPFSTRQLPSLRYRDIPGSRLDSASDTQ